MHLARSTIWSFSLGFFFLGWIFFPIYRLFTSIGIILHIPVLIWGISTIQSQFFCKVYIRNRELTDNIALTFDDGPDPDITPEILDLLDIFNQKATFFVIAERAQKYPDIVKRISNAGHVIGCHDLNHSLLSNFRLQNALTKEIGKAQQILQQIIGQKPLLYRPPVGLMNPHKPKALKNLNMKCIGWSTSAREGGNRIKNRIMNIPKLAESGEVILLHDSLPIKDHKELLIDQITTLLNKIKVNNLQSVTIDSFFNIRAYA